VESAILPRPNIFAEAVRIHDDDAEVVQRPRVQTELMPVNGTKRTYRGKRSFVRFWGKADMARPPLAYRPVADDLKRT